MTATTKQIEELPAAADSMSQSPCVFYSDESDPVAAKLSKHLAEESSFSNRFIIVSSLADLARILSTESATQQQRNALKLLFFINEPHSLQSYVQNMLDESSAISSFSRSWLKPYLVMRRPVSNLGAQLARSSVVYQSLFGDEWWLRLDWSSPDLGGCIGELADRLIKYVSTVSGEATRRELVCQVGELMINQMVDDDLSSKFIPFLSEVRIGKT